MKTTFESIQSATVKASVRIKVNTSILDRETILIEELSKLGIECISVGEKPAKGANLSIICMKNKYRINYRCGYSRNNYAPCVEVMRANE